MSITSKIVNAVRMIRSRGLLETARYASLNASEGYHEWRLGIRTAGKVGVHELGITCPVSHYYFPSDYRSIYRALARLRIEPGKDVFLDYGCGMGRVLVVASALPFKRVMGVDVSSELCEIARQNLRTAAAKLRCQDWDVLNADATRFEVPDEVSVVFFFNPFHGAVLSSVLGNLRASLVRTPRKMTIVFKNTKHLGPHLEEHSWLVKRAEFRACDADHRVAILEGFVEPVMAV